MSIHGVVRTWHSDDGWGVLDSPDTPGGCWAHFSALRMAGHKKLEPGQEVELDVEVADQDGFGFRAVRVWPVGTTPVHDPVPEGPSEAYRSELRINWEKPV